MSEYKVYWVRMYSSFDMCPKCHPIPYIAHYGPWSKVVHFIGNRVTFEAQLWLCSMHSYHVAPPGDSTVYLE